jgi:hypothetical protein
MSKPSSLPLVLAVFLFAGCGSARSDGTPSDTDGGASTSADAGHTATDGGTVSGGTVKPSCGQTGNAANGTTLYTVDGASYEMPGLFSTSLMGNMVATWGGGVPVTATRCDNVTASLQVGSTAGKHVVTVSDGNDSPKVIFNTPGDAGFTVLAGWQASRGCAPCGTGSITVDSIDAQGARGSYDVTAPEINSHGQPDNSRMHHVVGTFATKFGGFP